MSVSYTHLDVYKRQAQDSGADAVQQQAPESPADADDKKFNSMLDGIFGKEAK